MCNEFVQPFSSSYRDFFPIHSVNKKRFELFLSRLLSHREQLLYILTFASRNIHFSIEAKRDKKGEEEKNVSEFRFGFFFSLLHFYPLFFQWDSTCTVIDPERLNLSYSYSILVTVADGSRLTLKLRPKNDWNWMAIEATTGKRWKKGIHQIFWMMIIMII